MTRDEIIRLTRNLVEAETAYATVRTAYEGDAHNAALRFESVDAWNTVQRARRAMAGIDARDLLRALTVRPVRKVEQPDRRGKRVTLEEVQAAIAAVDGGETIYSVAMRTGRRYNTIVQAVGRYRAGKSGLAKLAKANGTWKATK